MKPTPAQLRARIYALCYLAVIIAGICYLIFKTNGNKTNEVLNQSAQSNQQAPCDESKWKHVYNSSRLEVKSSCVTVTGTIEVERKEKDGDEHILLRLDAGQENLINEKNISKQHGCLVLEPICVGKVSQKDAIDDCSNYLNDVSIPSKGSHVTVTGTYVLDKHHGWMEIHPVTSIISK